VLGDGATAGHAAVDSLDLRFDARIVAEQPARFRLGVLARESAPHELVDAALDVKRELGVDVGFDAHPSERNSEDAPEAAPIVGAHVRAPLAAITSPTASV